MHAWLDKVYFGTFKMFRIGTMVSLQVNRFISVYDRGLARQFGRHTDFIGR